MTMDTDERLAALESQVKTLSGFLRRSGQREAMAQQSQLESRLAPSLLPPDDTMRGAAQRLPDLGNTLIDRLRADSSMGQLAAGSGLSALSSGNLLLDPTFDGISTAALVPTGSWQSLSHGWEYRLVQTGDAPAQVILSREFGRDFYSSVRPYVYARWAAASAVGSVTVQLRSTETWVGQVPPIAWPWVVAAVRAYTEPEADREGTATVSVAIEQDDGTELALSDPTDVETLGGAALEGQPYVGLEDPTSVFTGIDRPHLRIDVTIGSTGASSSPREATVVLAEPQLAYADEESPQRYEPAVGRWGGIKRFHGVVVERTTEQQIGDDNPTVLNFPTQNISSSGSVLGIHDSDDATEHPYYVAPAFAWYEARIDGRWDADAAGYRLVSIDQRFAGGGVVTLRRSRIGAAPVGQTEHGCTWKGRLNPGDAIYFRAAQSAGHALDVWATVSVEIHAWNET